jgi:hypothetical protein
MGCNKHSIKKNRNSLSVKWSCPNNLYLPFKIYQITCGFGMVGPHTEFYNMKLAGGNQFAVLLLVGVSTCKQMRNQIPLAR